LLALRDDIQQIPYPGCWDILGGHIDEGETSEACIRREIMEEVNIKIRRPKLFRIYEMPDRTEYTFWQRADFDLQKIKLNEGQRLRWFTESKIRRMTTKKFAFGFKRVLLDFFKEKPFAHRS
jgi:8-oxo-dGTP diphosphatase